MSRRRTRPNPPPPVTAEAVARELVKALRLPSGATATPIAEARHPQQQVQAWRGGQAAPLAPGGWNDPLVAFGPGRPSPPALIDPVEAWGRPLPRRTEGPVSFNLPGADNRLVTWEVLRRLADGVGIIRRCIEIRKSQMVALEWDFVVDESVFEAAMLQETANGTGHARALAAAMGDPDAQAAQATANPVTRRSVENEFRAQNAAAITKAKRWWKKPDRISDWAFEAWLSAALEEWLVLDALTLYPHLDRSGEMHSLECIDGSTIKPLLDHRFATPQPPNPAYQQVIHGFARGEFTATPGDDNVFDRDTLIYRPRMTRTFSPYGFGPTEQSILDADLYLKRRAWMDAEYTDGVAPELLVQVDAPMTPRQLADYETVFNDALTGDLAARHRAKFLPQGFTPFPLDSMETKYKPDYDLYLIRLIGLHFDVMPTEMGFPPSGGLGGKGFSEGEENSTYRKSIIPTAKWLKGIINEISVTWLRMPEGLTFKFLGLEAEDQATALAAREGLVSKGGMTLNEIRDEIGQPRYSFPEADIPMVMTGRDVIPIPGLMERAAAAAAQPPKPPGQESAPPSGSNEGGDAEGRGSEAGNAEPPANSEPQPPKATKASGTAVVAAGLAVVAGDTGRVLMLQRALDVRDPAGGTWEFPGGHLEPGEDPLAAAKREWAEEVGVPVPDGAVTGTWTGGVYQGFVWRIPGEALVHLNPDTAAVTNPDDPDGDVIEVVAWWPVDHLDADNPALRAELRASLDTVRAALGEPDVGSVTETGKAAEAKAWRAYVKNGRRTSRPWRPFTFAHHPGSVASAANGLAEAGDWAAALLVLDLAE